MPIYEYRCKKCGHQTEVLVRPSDKPPARCRECGGRLEKLISSPAIQFKGEGWYITDYARKGAGEKVEKETSAEPSADKSAVSDNKEKPKKAAKKTEKG